jgi:hypothetical protein
VESVRAKHQCFTIPSSGCGIPSTALAYSLNVTVVPTTTALYYFYPLTPCRVMDTRGPIGPLGGPIIAGGANRTVPMLSSSCGIPAGAAAYSLNMTVVPTVYLDYLTTWPTGIPQPLVSTLNDPTGTVVANAVIVPAGTGGSIDVFVTKQTHLIVDINGYFAPPGTSGLLFYPMPPCRVVDTRNHSYDASIVSSAAIVPTTTGAINAFASDMIDLILDLNGVFAP